MSVEATLLQTTETTRARVQRSSSLSPLVVMVAFIHHTHNIKPFIYYSSWASSLATHAKHIVKTILQCQRHLH